MDVVGILWRGALVIVVGYLLGGIPFGLIVSKRLHGVDISKEGSGNTGATNVFRVLGWKAALIVAVLDVAKGAVPALLALLIADPAWTSTGSDLLIIAAGVSAMAGHMFSPYFNLKGGKGIATAGGAILVLMPAAFGVLMVIFVAAILIGRIVSAASILAALVFPAIIWLLYPDRPVLFGFALIVVPLVLWAHRSNIKRLVRGEESRITMGRGRKGDEKE